MVIVELVYLRSSQEKFLKEFQLEEGSTIEDLVRCSGILAIYDELIVQIDRGGFYCGVFSIPARLGQTLQNGDRVEIYRRLSVGARKMVAAP